MLGSARGRTTTVRRPPIGRTQARAGIGLIVALVVTMAPAPLLANEPGSDLDTALLAELGDRAVLHEEGERLRFARGTPSNPAAKSARLGRPAGARGAANAFMRRYGPLFAPAGGRAFKARTETAAGNSLFVRFQQLEGGIPVLGADVTVQATDAGDVVAAIGEASSAPPVELRPAVSRADAAAEARRAVARAHDASPEELVATQGDLRVYDPTLLGPSKWPFARLVWLFEVQADGGATNDLVLIDARNGAVALRFSQVAHAKSRRVCDAGNTSAQFPCTAPVRTESAGTSAVTDVNRAFDFAGHTYDFFYNRFGRDSLNGAGMPLVATVRYCDFGCSYNAFWTQGQAAFTPGMAADDVVAHEFVHGLTEHTSRLFYYYQSGAINEALSDIFGEFIDQTNGAGTDTSAVRWLMGEDTPLSAIRSMADPPAFGHPDRMRSSLYTADPDEMDGGGVHHNSGVANKAAFLMAQGQTFNGRTVTGIGIDKTAAVWYRAASSYLGSASDYADLGLALNQSCTDLVGSSVRNSAGTVTGTVAAADCTQVANAVTATEMEFQPTVAGAAAPEAPVCSSGNPSNIFFDQVASGAPGWAVSGAANRWFYDDVYATSVPWHLWGDAPGSAGASQLRMATAVSVPANAFLHFRHAYGFDDYGSNRYDGGVLEYELNGSGSWADAGSLMTHNGYNGTIRSYSGGGNPLAGRPAFTAESNGYISTRVNLASIAGSSVRFRFNLGTDASVADYGWFIDDVRIYTCSGGDATPPTVTPPQLDFRPGVTLGTGSTPTRLVARFTASDASGVASTQLERRVNSGSFTAVPLPSASATTANVSLAVSTSDAHQFRARATDSRGNVSGWATSDPFKVVAYQNGASTVAQSGTWTSASNTSFFGGSVRHSVTAGAKQVRTGTASDFAIVSTKGPNRGKAQVYVDGTLAATIDLYSATTKYRQVVYTISFPSAGTHTIELRVTRTRNAASSGFRVDFDAFLALTP